MIALECVRLVCVPKHHAEIFHISSKSILGIFTVPTKEGMFLSGHMFELIPPFQGCPDRIVDGDVRRRAMRRRRSPRRSLLFRRNSFGFLPEGSAVPAAHLLSGLTRVGALLPLPTFRCPFIK